MAAVDDVRLLLATSEDTFAAGTADPLPCFFVTFDDAVVMDNVGGGKQMVRRAYALVCADDFSTLSEDDAVTINGGAYTVLDTQLVQDGHMLQVNLQKAAD